MAHLGGAKMAKGAGGNASSLFGGSSQKDGSPFKKDVTLSPNSLGKV